MKNISLRRPGVTVVVVFMASAFAPGPTAAPASDAQGLPVEQLAPRVWRIESAAGSNVLVVAGTGGTLLVDAGPRHGVGALSGALDSLGVGPVRYVVNSHYHEDHIGGNAHFRERGAIVIAHPATRDEAQVDTVIADFNDWHREAAPAEALPDVTTSAELTIHLGSDTVHVLPFPGAHTSGDLVVRVEPAGIVHTGDIYEVGAYPFIDVWAGGTIAGIIETTDRLLADGRSGIRYVPGHGETGGRAALERYRSMLASVCTAVARERAAAADLSAVMDARTTAEFDDGEWGPARHGRILAALVYWSLERESGCSP